MTSYEDYLKALPAMVYNYGFMDRMNKTLGNYLIEHPELLPDGAKVSNDSDDYSVGIIMDEINELVYDDEFYVILMTNVFDKDASNTPDGNGNYVGRQNTIGAFVPLSILLDIGFEQYQENYEEAGRAMDFLEDSLERAQEYTKLHPELLPSGMVISDDYLEGYQLLFEDIPGIFLDANGEVICTVYNMDAQEFQHTFTMPFDAFIGRT